MRDYYDARDRKAITEARRQEQVRHLLRSVGVEMGDGQRLPYFVELAPGRFRPNPALESITVEDDRFCTLPVASDTPAKIPADGLPLDVLKYLIRIGLRGGDSL